MFVKENVKKIITNKTGGYGIRPFLSSIQFIFKSQIIRYHRDKFAICRLSAVVLNGVSKITVQRIHVASIPRDLDGVANGTLNARGGGLVFLENYRTWKLVEKGAIIE
jgi:hypothetical protein